ncbi:hypothetical protein TWF594_002732 [Orbilia oligospora]|nr:hypothetical protein TWF594_002732 [Orbilia oligospora]
MHAQTTTPPLFSSPVLSQVLIRYYCNTSNGFWVKNPTFHADINGVTICWVATVVWGALKRLETGSVDSSCTLRSLNGHYQYAVYTQFWNSRRLSYQTSVISSLIEPIRQKLDAYGVLADKHHVVSMPMEDTEEGLALEDALLQQIENANNVKAAKDGDLQEDCTDPKDVGTGTQEADVPPSLTLNSELDTPDR